MKRNFIISLIILISIGLIGGYFLIKNDSKSDAIKFKNEYETLNTELDDEGNNKYTKISISKNNKIKYLTYDELIDFIDNKTGILYFGRPGCPWCRLLVPTVLDFAKENKINIYYYNIEKDREENNDKYKNILKLLNEYLPTDTVTQNQEDSDFNENLKRVILPHLFFIQKGQVKDEIMLYQHEYLKNKEDEKIKALLSEKYNTIK